MKIVLNIKKRYAYFIIGLLVLSAGIFAVNAFGGSQPSFVGHSVGEIDWSESISKLNVDEICLNGNCITDWSGIESIYNLVYDEHTIEQCTDLGGIVVTEISNKFCSFSQSSCPSGWIQYDSWSATIAGSNNYIDELIIGNCETGSIEQCSTATRTCTTASHNWASIARESKTCYGKDVIFKVLIFGNCVEMNACPGKTDTTAYATITQIGCY